MNSDLLTQEVWLSRLHTYTDDAESSSIIFKPDNDDHDRIFDQIQILYNDVDNSIRDIREKLNSHWAQADHSSVSHSDHSSLVLLLLFEDNADKFACGRLVGHENMPAIKRMAQKAREKGDISTYVILQEHIIRKYLTYSNKLDEPAIVENGLKPYTIAYRSLTESLDALGIHHIPLLHNLFMHKKAQSLLPYVVEYPQATKDRDMFGRCLVHLVLDQTTDECREASSSGMKGRQWEKDRSETSMVFEKALTFLFHKSVGNRDNSGRTPLHVACYKRPDLAIQHLNKNPASYSIQDNAGRRPLHYACAGNDPELIELLLGLGDINCRDGKGRTPLAYALHLQTVKLLVKAGAIVDSVNARGETPLFRAAAQASTAVVSYLIKAGANVNSLDQDRRTPLTAAAEYGSGDNIQCLLKAGADPNLADIKGQTPLFWAAEKDFIFAVKYLVKAGAKMGWVDGKGETAVQCAAEAGSVDVVRYLLTVGARDECVMGKNMPLMELAKRQSDAQPPSFMR
ncbi:hypothetical protein S40288_03656 [Stachybotrys chartarum IBT 40288]|nr:hypothetical protein S40288_03656 [Stachybotrys chartarum IBT 40288]